MRIRAILEKSTDFDFLRFVPIVFRKNGLAPLYYKPFQKNTLSLLKIPILFILGIFEIACRKTHRQNETSKSERSNTVIFS
ncbi:hypothetical protein LEP1GSC070_2578 [Leptospira santarosai str. AIM]|nr:hypothetical protein LEP1GSC070_2578 [Leptospira santarosai str. AIM]